MFFLAFLVLAIGGLEMFFLAVLPRCTDDPVLPVAVVDIAIAHVQQLIPLLTLSDPNVRCHGHKRLLCTSQLVRALLLASSSWISSSPPLSLFPPHFSP